MARDKASLDIFWLRDESLDDSATLPHPSILAAEIVEDLRAALAQFQEIADDLATDEATVSSGMPREAVFANSPTMSDIKRFRIQGDAVEQLQGSSVAIEVSLQELIERHPEALLGVRFLAHEYQTGKTHGGRIDTPGIDENGSPVIIKYERALNRPLPPHDLRLTLVAQPYRDEAIAAIPARAQDSSICPVGAPPTPMPARTAPPLLIGRPPASRTKPGTCRKPGLVRAA